MIIIVVILTRPHLVGFGLYSTYNYIVAYLTDQPAVQNERGLGR